MIDLFEDALLPYPMLWADVRANVRFSCWKTSKLSNCSQALAFCASCDIFHIDHSESVRTFCVFFHCVICTEIRRLQSF